MLKYRACYNSSFISSLENEIKSITNLYVEDFIRIEIKDKDVFIVEGKMIKKSVDIKPEEFWEFFKKQNVLVRADDKNDIIEYPIQDEEVYNWEVFVDETKISSQKNSFMIYHSYSLDLLFVLAEDKEVLTLINPAYQYDKADFMKKLQEGGSENYQKKVGYLNQMLEGGINVFF